MKIKFIRDTFFPADTFRAKGETLDVSPPDGCNLICRGKAQEVTAEEGKAPKKAKAKPGEPAGEDPAE